MVKIELENLKLLFNVTRDQLINQMELSDELNTKASTVMGFIGVIVGVIFGFTFLLNSLPVIALYSLKISTFFLMLAFIFSLIGFKNRVYRYDPDPKSLIEYYLLKDSKKSMETIIYNFVDSFESNKGKLVRKGRCINISLYLVFISLITLAIGIFLG